MNSYFQFLLKYSELYPLLSLNSSFFTNNEGLFILDPSLPINIIKEDRLNPFLGVNRIIKYFLIDGTLRTHGETKVCINYTVVEFQTIICDDNSDIIGVLGLPFSFDIINELI